ncbi:GTP pyrophosphokinase [Sphingomonas sp. T1]|uniref:RelA/SpoT domain-containing protein n=1 Tax=Sphingomonas sp. T1 TaxID=2653172 RepID=UPI0012F055AE|nr:RelA/SpoT domain-containing protein [Sphingomonas sp. T1]VXC98331.1 GTP pyrophosphokinase [Sphingomonas sp. T1]
MTADGVTPADPQTVEIDVVILDEETLVRFDSMKHELGIFMDGVLRYLGDHPDLRIGGKQIVHSYKSRLKDREHLRSKLARKRAEGRPVAPDDLFRRVTDLAGVRIIHLFQEHFSQIDRLIRGKVVAGDWVLDERATAYTWDPEAADYFGAFDLSVVQKPTSYTSVHYLLRPRADSPLCCEVQVRTLFEEIWGEVDHQINYPVPTKSLACGEQIKVLSKLVGAGSRLLDSLHRVHQSSISEETAPR